MEFKEFCRQRKRMCERYSRCIGCGLRELNSCTDISEMEMEEQLDAAEAIVQQWAAEHSKEPPAFTEDKPPKTYDQGLEDAWELAKDINNLNWNDIKHIFGDGARSTRDVMDMYTQQEAAQKLQEWKDKQCESEV